MHYKNGTPAKVGDRIIAKDHQGLPVSGIVVATTPGADSCNLLVAPIHQPYSSGFFTASECLTVDDALDAYEPKEAGGNEIAAKL